MIKKFSSPKIKIWFEPMFFSGFFCGFERCNSSAFLNFCRGTSSPPQAVKCVRTNSRILHHVGEVKEFWFASLCEAKTAKEPGRMKFAEMLSLLEKRKADGIISWHPDRLARNSVDGGKIIHFVDRGLIKSLKFPYLSQIGARKMVCVKISENRLLSPTSKKI